MNKVGIAVIGLGYWGPNLLRNFSQCKETTLLWGCDTNEKRLETFREMYGQTKFTANLEEVLNDPAVVAVSIATPLSTHFALAKKALEAGKHVMVEKPLTATSIEAKELIALAESLGKVLMVDHTFIYEDAVRAMKQYVDDGSLGKLLYYDSARINLGLIQKDTNVLWDLAIHDLAILNHLKPLTGVKTVLASGEKHHTDQVEMAHLHLGYEDGFSAHIYASWLSPVKIRQTLVGGTDKMLVYNDNEPSEKIRLYDKGVTVAKEDQSFALPIYRAGDILIPRLQAVEPLKIIASHFATCVRGEETPRTPGKNSLQIIDILEHADRSMAEGRTLTRQ